MHLLNPTTVTLDWITVVVLSASFLIDGTVLYNVCKDILKTKPKEVSVIQHFKGIRDPMTVAVLLEDSAACAGVAIAASGLVATHITGNPMYDAMATIGIGGLLGLVSISLIWMNQIFLIGKALDPEDRKSVV